MTDEVYAELEEVAKRAEAAPLPKKAVDLTSIYAPLEVSHGKPMTTESQADKEMRVQEALREALRYEMARDERVYSSWARTSRCLAALTALPAA